MDQHARTFVPVALIILLAGCTPFTESGRRDRFEHSWNSAVGEFRDVPRWHKEVLLETRIIDASTTEYVIRQLERCQIGIAVNARLIIQSWRYVGDPKDCWIYFPTAP